MDHRPVVPVTGLEPVRYFYQRILGPLCLPFHHTGILRPRHCAGSGCIWHERELNPLGGERKDESPPPRPWGSRAVFADGRTRTGAPPGYNPIGSSN